MAGRDVLSSEIVGLAKHLTPLDRSVTPYTRIRCIACHVVIDEVINDLLAERGREINGIVRHAELQTYPPCVVDPVK